MNALINCLCVAAGGAIGALSRYGVEQLGVFDDNKYYYTVIINVTGCFLMGVLWALLQYLNADIRWSLFLLTGVLGGYTTYSAFTLDAMQLVQSGMIDKFFFYVGITLVGGIGSCAIGLFGMEKILKMI